MRPRANLSPFVTCRPIILAAVEVVSVEVTMRAMKIPRKGIGIVVARRLKMGISKEYKHLERVDRLAEGFIIYELSVSLI